MTGPYPSSQRGLKFISPCIITNLSCPDLADGDLLGAHGVTPYLEVERAFRRGRRGWVVAQDQEETAHYENGDQGQCCEPEDHTLPKSRAQETHILPTRPSCRLRQVYRHRQGPAAPAGEAAGAPLVLFDQEAPGQLVLLAIFDDAGLAL